jgi:hypothetical protein
MNVSKAGKVLKVGVTEELRAECKAKGLPVSKKKETMKIRIEGVEEQNELHGVMTNEELDSLLISFFKSKSREIVRDRSISFYSFFHRLLKENCACIFTID